MNKEELEKIFDEKVTSMRIYDEYRNEITDDIKEFIFDTVIPEVLKSVMPWDNSNVAYYFSKDNIKQKVKEQFNINL